MLVHSKKRIQISLEISSKKKKLYFNIKVSTCGSVSWNIGFKDINMTDLADIVDFSNISRLVKY